MYIFNYCYNPLSVSTKWASKAITDSAITSHYLGGGDLTHHLPSQGRHDIPKCINDVINAGDAAILHEGVWKIERKVS